MKALGGRLRWAGVTGCLYNERLAIGRLYKIEKVCRKSTEHVIRPRRCGLGWFVTQRVEREVTAESLKYRISHRCDLERSRLFDDN
jgi:hypothetical protein